MGGSRILKEGFGRLPSGYEIKGQGEAGAPRSAGNRCRKVGDPVSAPLCTRALSILPRG